MSAKVSVMKNPLHIKEEPSLMPAGEFKTKMFRISNDGILGDGTNDDKKAYEEFMQSMNPFSLDSNIIPNPYSPSPVMRTWDTRSGDMLIYVEYIIIKEVDQEDENDPDKREY